MQNHGQKALSPVNGFGHQEAAKVPVSSPTPGPNEEQMIGLPASPSRPQSQRRSAENKRIAQPRSAATGAFVIIPIQLEGPRSRAKDAGTREPGTEGAAKRGPLGARCPAR
ncbi:hypothetical protein MC885_002019, partial [Smutsia gigantea]